VNATDPSPKPGLPAALKAARRAWLELTLDEQRALVIILGLFLLGVAARLWHAGRATF